MLTKGAQTFACHCMSVKARNLPFWTQSFNYHTVLLGNPAPRALMFLSRSLLSWLCCLYGALMAQRSGHTQWLGAESVTGSWWPHQLECLITERGRPCFKPLSVCVNFSCPKLSWQCRDPCLVFVEMKCRHVSRWVERLCIITRWLPVKCPYVSPSLQLRLSHFVFPILNFNKHCYKKNIQSYCQSKLKS